MILKDTAEQRRHHEHNPQGARENPRRWEAAVARRDQRGAAAVAAPGRSRITVRVVQVERELQETLRKTAREALGPQATDSEVERLAGEVYNGPAATDMAPETDGERARRQRRTRLAIEEMDRWGKGAY